MSLLIFAIIGFVLGLLVRKDSARGMAEKDIRANISRQLEQTASHEHDERFAAGLREAARQVRHPLVYEETRYSHVSDESSHEQIDTATLSPDTQANDKKPSRQFDDASVLLYFGAFLMVAGVGLFVGLSDVSGGIKTFAVLILGLILYGAGLVMYRTVSRLKPAAIALTSIGLICLPLTGVAAHFYVSGALSGAWIWAMTSFVSLVLYIIALIVIRQSLIGYMSVFMCLSLWLSIVSVVHAPLYFFGWTMIVLGMLYVLTLKYCKVWHEVEAPLSVSATIMVPTALCLTILFGYPSISLLQQGITVLLAAAFYALSVQQETSQRLRLIYFVFAHSLVPIGIYMLAMNSLQSAVAAAWIVNGTAIVQVILSTVWRKTHAAWAQAVLIVAASVFAMSTLLAIPVMSGEWAVFAWLLGFVMTVCAAIAICFRNKWHAILALMALTILPSLVGYLACQPHLPTALISSSYVIIGITLMVAGRWLKDFGFIDLTRISYIAALLLAWCIGQGKSGWVPMASSLSVGLVVLTAAYYEHAARALYVGLGMCTLAALQSLLWLDTSWQSAFVVTICCVGVVYYGIGKALLRARSPQTYVDPWITCGLLAIYSGALGGIAVTGGVSWFSVVFLALAGCMTSYETRRIQQHEGIYVGAAVVMVAFQMAIYKLGVYEWQLYWYLWSLYIVVIAYMQREIAAIVIAVLIMSGGLGVGLFAHHLTDISSVSVICSLVAIGLYGVGKLHRILPDRKRWAPFIEVWSLIGLFGIYLMGTFPLWFGIATDDNFTGRWNALMIILAGALTCYEAFTRRSQRGIYGGAAVSLAGLEWLLFTQQIHNVQLYTHLWIAYFVALAWLAYHQKREDEKQLFTVLALSMQTIPLAWQALAGDQGMGILLLFESVVILLIGLRIRYRLVMRWGLSVAVGSVLYQLRAYQFFVLVLLGAGIIALGVYMLIRQDKK